jgi:hypothetical protein
MCFVATVTIANGVEDYKANMVETNSEEMCNAVTMHEPKHLVVVGNKAMDGNNIPLMGFLSVLDKNNLENMLDETSFVDQDNRFEEIVYPVAVTTGVDDGDDVYIASLTSIDAFNNDRFFPYPDWLKTQKFGSSFDMHVTKMRLNRSPGVGGGSGSDNSDFDGIGEGGGGNNDDSITVSKAWTTEFPLYDSSQMVDGVPPRVYIGGILHKKTSSEKSIVIVVGSTRGEGDGYGSAVGNDSDGFVTVVDSDSGTILGKGVREGSSKDDIVTSVCDDPNDPEHFYIVGGTEGQIGTDQSGSLLDVEGISRLPDDSATMLMPFVRQLKVYR